MTYKADQKNEGIVEKTGSIFDDQKSLVYLDQDLRKLVRVTQDVDGNLVKIAL